MVCTLHYIVKEQKRVLFYLSGVFNYQLLYLTLSVTQFCYFITKSSDSRCSYSKTIVLVQKMEKVGNNLTPKESYNFFFFLLKVV